MTPNPGNGLDIFTDRIVFANAGSIQTSWRRTKAQSSCMICR